MGSPDFPNEDDSAHSFQPPPSHALPMHGIDSDDEDDSDDNDESIPSAVIVADQQNQQSNEYAGYQPLNFEQMAVDDDDDDDDDEDDSDENDEDNRQNSHGRNVNLGNQQTEHLTTLPGTAAEPPVNTAEREILKEIWNAPRPKELDIELDSSKSDEIKSVMSNVSLGLSAIKPPDWAVNVPESKWIEELLQEVRNRQNK